MKRCLLKCGIKPPLHNHFRREIKQSKLVSQLFFSSKLVERKKSAKIKRYALNKYQSYFYLLETAGRFKGFNPTYISNLSDYYNPIKTECVLTSLDRALDIQGEIYLLSNKEKRNIKESLRTILKSTKEEVEREEYHLNSWLNNDYITVIKVKGEDRSECYISWYDYNNLSPLLKSYVSSYISNNSLPSLEESKNRVHYENFLIKIFSKIRKNQIDPLNEMARYLMYQSVKGVIDLAPYVLKKTFLKKPFLKKISIDKTYILQKSVYSGDDFCKDLLFWEYCPPKYRNNTSETDRLNLTSWKTIDCDKFLLKQVLNYILKIAPRNPK